MKLLCVDSEPVYREIVSLCAEKLDIQVKSVATYEEAIDAFSTYAPDIITLDIILKGGSGFDLIQQLKLMAGSRFIPIIVLASHTSDIMMDKCFQVGADDFLSKPFNEVLFNIRFKTHMRHVELMKEMYRKNRTLTYFQKVIEREHEMAHQVLNHIQMKSEKNSEHLAITRLSAAIFNGDLALVKTRSDGARLVFVGDFTGHGLPASIGALPVMQAFFDAVENLTSVSELGLRINQILLGILPDYMFCAGYLMLISPNGEIQYWGGGMPNALIRRATGKIQPLTSIHMPLGVLPSSEFESILQNEKLDQGDTLVILSDGVLELKNHQNLMLGEEKVNELIIEAYGEEDLVEAQKKVEKRLVDHLGESEQFDDITLVSLRRTH